MQEESIGGNKLKFDVYGRFMVEVIRRDGNWEVYRTDIGKRVRMHEVVIPSEMSADRIPYFLEDLWHESAAPGKTIRTLD
jgi:hypothetical protein